MIGTALKTIRESRGFKQEWVSSQTGISQSTICHMELGKRGITLKSLHKLSSFYGLSSLNETIVNHFKQI